MHRNPLRDRSSVMSDKFLIKAAKYGAVAAFRRIARNLSHGRQKGSIS